MIVPIDPRTVEPDYEPVNASLEKFVSRFGQPRMIHQSDGVATYGWWIEADYVSLRVEGDKCWTYYWRNRPAPQYEND